MNGENATATRFRADRAATARLSPYLRFGELSPRQVYSRCAAAAGGGGAPGSRPHQGGSSARSARVFLRRLAWRDLFYWALWRFPHIPFEPLRPQFAEQWWDLGYDPVRDDPERALSAAPEVAGRRWRPEHAGLRAWQRGQTGFPLVDAAMRELWVTGWIPNYLRHVVASFLVEYLGARARASTSHPRYSCAAFSCLLFLTLKEDPTPSAWLLVEKPLTPPLLIPRFPTAGIDWRHGALWFSETLVDADVAINACMWQNGVSPSSGTQTEGDACSSRICYAMTSKS